MDRSDRVNTYGFVIGSRRESAMKLAKVNAERAKTAWLEHIPRDPRELADTLRQAGIDLDSLREALT